MRASGCAVQQSLTTEAAAVVKQAMELAKRRGHAQVTPLHVANTMLSAPNGILRTACLQSNSHPLRCKALELCFSVALNRLPAASSPVSPILVGPHHHRNNHHHHQQFPSISNALVAAFKRAQAHQRRGSIENQQQPLLAVKIELEQLIISILDDPSVSRVMREAGFSSTQVKANVEKSVSLELCTSQTPQTKPKEVAQIGEKIRSEDLNMVIESLMSKKARSFVIVGESIQNIEGLVNGLMERINKGNNVPNTFREVKFITIPLYSFANLEREEVEQRIGELICHVKSLVEKGVALYFGDLKWIADFRVSKSGSGLEMERRRNNGVGGFGECYCPIEHVILELGRLACGEIIGEFGKFWLMGIATFQTYAKCRSGRNSLESVWNLHPITIPANTLGLSLLPDSEGQIEARSKDDEKNEVENQLNCCGECAIKFENEARNLQNGNSSNESTLSSLPPWLKDESKRLQSNDQKCVSIKELCEKWNSICSSSHNHKHQQPKLLERTLTFPSSSPSSSTSCFSYDEHNPNNPFQRHYNWIHPASTNDNEINLIGTCPRTYNSTPNSASSTEVMETEDYTQKFKEFNAENVNILCNALERKVARQKDIIPEIVGTILQCRSGMLRRKEKRISTSNEVKEETWLFFLGVDVQAKEEIARELAKLVFGSYLNFVPLALSNFSSSKKTTATITDSNFHDHVECARNKRSRDEQSCSSYIERFAQAVHNNPHCVFYVEDVEQVDYLSQMGIRRAIRTGKITKNSSNGEEIQELSLEDAIVILSCESFSSRSRACSPSSTANKQKSDNGSSLSSSPPTLLRPTRIGSSSGGSNGVSLDLNLSFEDENHVEREDDENVQTVDELGLLENVDGRIVFRRIQDF